MPALDPDRIDYGRIDHSALLETRGIAVVDELRAKLCEKWLEREGYQRHVLDCATGFEGVLRQLDRLLNWETQFGYALESGRANLNALADGFEFNVPEGQGVVLELLHAEELARVEPQWFHGLLEIACGHSLFQLACGRRFFTLLIVKRESTLPGTQFASLCIPSIHWHPDARRQGFLE